MAAVGADLLSMLCIAGHVTKPIPARIQYAPSAGLVCTEVIAMRVLGRSAVVIISVLGCQNYCHAVSQILSIPPFFFHFFLAAITPCPT